MSCLTKPIKTRLVGGFLGAGKTTFILEQLKTAGAKVAVLVNEFGQLGIDGALIRLNGGIDVVELPGGCICCSQKQGLLESIRSIAGQIGPELLLIEPSGVAEISEILQVLSDPSLAGVIRIDAVITVLDAETFLEFSEPEAFGLFFLDQVRCADLILVNRADLVTPQTLEAIEERVAALNPLALLVRTEFCRMDVAVPHGTKQQLDFSQKRVPLGIDCLSINPEKPFSEEGLADFIAELARGRFGRIIRGKGFIQVAGRGWMNLQMVAGNVTTKPLSTAMAARLTLIGFDLRATELDAFLNEL
ncbi:MAG: GTP-binding protein [Steroidobacteraceae bacterium]|nr:GTP-binding protein [Deltaproteobacteria bacterium]